MEIHSTAIFIFLIISVRSVLLYKVNLHQNILKTFSILSLFEIFFFKINFKWEIMATNFIYTGKNKITPKFNNLGRQRIKKVPCAVFINNCKNIYF